MAPKYEQLVMALRQTLPQWHADGQRKLPCEQELAAQFSVSRQTLRQALAVLEQEGLIEKRRGSGSFLCPAAANQDRRIAVIATSLRAARQRCRIQTPNCIRRSGSADCL